MKKLAFAALLMTGCGLGEKLKDAADQIKDDIVSGVIDEAVQGAIDGAEQAGGAGEVVTTAGATVEVTDPESPLFGASVVLAADSLPSGVTQAVLTIIPADVSGAGFHAAAAPASDYVASGPAINVELKSIPTADGGDLEVIQPTKDATVTVPLVDAPAGVTVTEVIVLAHIEGSDMVDPITGTVNAAGDRVSGLTASFSPFVAAREVVPPIVDPCDMSDVVEGELSLSVTGADTFTADYDSVRACGVEGSSTGDIYYTLADSADSSNVFFEVKLSLAGGQTLADVATGQDVTLAGNIELLASSVFTLANASPYVREGAQPGADTTIRITLVNDKADVCIQNADQITGFYNGNSELDYVQPVVKFRCAQP